MAQLWYSLLTGSVGKARSRSIRRTVDHLHAAFYPGFTSKAVRGFRWYFHSAQRDSVHNRVSQEGSGLRLHNTMPSPTAAAACLSDLWNSTIAGQITDRNTKQAWRAASDLVERGKNEFKTRRNLPKLCLAGRLTLFWHQEKVNNLSEQEILLETVRLNAKVDIIVIPFSYLHPSDIRWVYLCSFIFCYLQQLLEMLKREVKLKQKSNFGMTKNRIMFLFAWMNVPGNIALAKVLPYRH